MGETKRFFYLQYSCLVLCCVKANLWSTLNTYTGMDNLLSVLIPFYPHLCMFSESLQVRKKRRSTTINHRDSVAKGSSKTTDTHKDTDHQFLSTVTWGKVIIVMYLRVFYNPASFFASFLTGIIMTSSTITIFVVVRNIWLWTAL